MGLLLYHLFLKLYPLGIRFASIWNEKAVLWIKGRKKFPATESRNKGNNIWMHCASLGEFEQGIPVAEQLKKLYPEYNLVVTFFSPSGYEIKKNIEGAQVFYLPIDSPSNAKNFIDLIEPKLVLWIRYEFWFFYLQELKKRNIPVLLISGSFRKGQPFFRWYGAMWRKMLQSYSHFFLQNELSQHLLQNIGITNSSVSRDTRFERVILTAENFDDVPMIKEFCGDNNVIVAGSTWEDDEVELIHYVRVNPAIKFIIAPHEVDKENLRDLKKEFPNSIFYSELVNTELTVNYQLSTVNCLIIDNIGLLSRLYKYADITYVGGGFGADGLHNILEPAVFGKPVIFGPEFEKNFEAAELIECGGGISIENALELEKVFNELWADETELKKRGEAAGNYVYSNAGASLKIIRFIQENRLLTN